MKKNRLAFISHPLSGDIEGNLKKVEGIMKAILSLHENITPVAPYFALTRVLDDNDPLEREKGIQACLDVLERCDELWVCGDETNSKGMQMEISYAFKKGIRVERLILSKDKFSEDEQ